ncbi:MAG: IS21-like element helper ATPase IstB [Cellulosilyticaceae bacterium]|uniref:IS21-like element helper ATPase IstB n=1 Tax=Niameybacter sp. TaxID=2033640 RepID=UPI002FCA6296
MDTLEEIISYSTTLKLPYLKQNIIQILDTAKKNDQTYQDFLHKLLHNEMLLRDERSREKRVKNAAFPATKTVDDFDLAFQKSISKRQLNELCELTWIDQMYNLILLGPPGVGKSHLAIALGHKAIEAGYNVSFVTMDLLMHTLKTAEISRKSKGKLNRILGSSLVIIDELGYLPISREEANLFFGLISTLHEQASVIITSNKGFEDWTELLGDPALTTAVLDRITYRCEVITMQGKSYRLEHRQSLFES